MIAFAKSSAVELFAVDYGSLSIFEPQATNESTSTSVQDLLGHATASFTLNRYVHTSEKMMADTASRVQSYYDNLKAGNA